MLYLVDMGDKSSTLLEAGEIDLYTVFVFL